MCACCSDLDDDIAGISALDSVQVMKCVAECLARILPDPSDQEHLPKVKMISGSMNMSVKYKYATQLSTSIQVSFVSIVGSNDRIVLLAGSRLQV